MKVLVLGNSGSTGAFVTGPSWGQQVKGLLQRELQAPVSLEDARFSAEAPNAARYAESKVVQLRPDVVVLPVASFPFTARFTWVRVRELFGERTGRWYKDLETQFDRGTRGRGRLGRLANSALRKTVRTVIGTRPLSTRPEVTASYLEILRTLSRVESVPVILVSLPGRGAHAQSEGTKAERQIFFADVCRAAESHRFPWINGQDAFKERAGRERVTGLDGLHFNETGHRVMAEAIAEAILGTIAERVLGGTS